MNLRVFLIYINTTIIFFSLTQIPLLSEILPPISVITVFILFATNLKLFLKNRYNTLLFLYLFCLIVATIMSKEKHFSYISIFFGPLLISTLIKKKELKFYRPLFYFFIGIFILNSIAAFYERIIGERLLPVAITNDTLQSQMINQNNNDSAFRSFAFFGHPLNNGNIMAFMSFIIFYTKSISQKTRFILTLLGLSSLFCFNARGAILTSGILFIPTLFNYIVYESKHRFTFVIFMVIFACILYANFDKFGGRLITSDINDDNTAVRLLSIQEFLSYSLTELLVGGKSMTYGENGYLMTIAYYGIILGSIKIIVEIFLSYKLIKNVTSKMQRIIIMLSLIAIGSTNNNLFFPVVFPLYILFITFVINNQKTKLTLNYNDKFQAKLQAIH